MEWRHALEFAEIFNEYGFPCRGLKDGTIKTMGGPLEIGVAYERYLPIGSVVVDQFKKARDRASKEGRIPIVAFPIKQDARSRDLVAAVPLRLLLDLLNQVGAQSEEEQESPR